MSSDMVERCVKTVKAAAMGALVAFGIILVLHAAIVGTWIHLADYGPLEWSVVAFLALLSAAAENQESGHVR